MLIRFFDVLFAIIGLLMLLPFLLIIALLIKLDSKGPIFFKQLRAGKHGKEFWIYKFRTMYVENHNKQLLTVGERDPRITNVGYFLRKFKIDEIPQLFNVLLNNMSLVGPRPEVKKYVDLYNSAQKKILSIKPGITDWASIFYSNESELLEKSENPEQYYIQHIMPHKIELNMYYLHHKNLKNYFKIILLTILKVLGKKV